jgi:GrpB-like predicted nucleotidyltransferase (UPF0157 family)
LWHDLLWFRDYLRAHQLEAKRYAALKAALPVGRGGWYSGRDKARFIVPVIESRTK